MPDNNPQFDDVQPFEQFTLPAPDDFTTQSDVQSMIASRMTNWNRVGRVQSGSLESGNFVSGSAGWQILSNGNAEFQNVNIGQKNITISSTDDIQMAVNTLNTAGGGILHLKAGTYNVTSAITVYSSIRIQGESPSTTTVNFGSTAANFTLTGTNVYTTGTISSISGGVNVVGSGTTWTSAMVGRQIFINNRWYLISAFTDTTHITLATGYADGATFSGTYRIASVIKDVEFIDFTAQSSVSTAIVGTDTRDIVLQDLILPSNNKGYAFTSHMNTQVLRVTIASSTSNGYELTNGSFFNASQLASISNGGHGALINNIKSSEITFSACDSNTSDGFNLTSVTNSIITAEAAGNGGQGIELVSGCDSLFMNPIVTSNTSDGIKLTASATNCIIYASNITGNGGYGVNIAASSCQNTRIGLSYFASNSSGSVFDAGTATLIRGNIGVADTASSTSLLIFGDGSDGDATISSPTTLTSDMYYNNLTVNTSTTLSPAGYRIFVQDTLTLNGTIARNGTVGNDGSQPNGGNAVTMAAGYLVGAPDSGAGGQGGTTGHSNGNAGSNGGAAANSIIVHNGAAGGAGGNAGAGINTGGGGGNGGTATASQVALKANWNLPVLLDITSIGSTIKMTAAGGGAGGGGGAAGDLQTQQGGGGGSGGGGGGIIAIYAKHCIFGASSSITANGANGGNGADGADAATHGAGGGGGGGGGNGGVIVFVYNSKTDNGITYSYSAGNGGTHGNGGGGTFPGSNGTDGSNGSAGTILQFQLAI